MTKKEGFTIENARKAVNYIQKGNPDPIQISDKELGEVGEAVRRGLIESANELETARQELLAGPEQASNTSRNVRFEYEGRQLSAEELAKLSVSGISSNTIRMRIRKLGMTAKEAISRPLGGYKKGSCKWAPEVVLEAYLAEGSFSSIARKYGMDRQTVANIKKGVSHSAVTAHPGKPLTSRPKRLIG